MKLWRYHNRKGEWQFIADVDSVDAVVSAIKSSPVVQPETVYVSELDYGDGCTRINARSEHGQCFSYRVAVNS